MSHSETCDTFRAADYTAVRTGSGSVAFVNLAERGSVPAGFIAEHVPQHRPASIEDGLCHPALSERGRADVADSDKLIGANYISRRLVELMSSRMGNLGVDRLGAAFVACALERRQADLRISGNA